MSVNDKIKYSIIIPVYNRESTIAEVLDAIFNLIIPEIEVIVFDDFSNDNTAEILKRYPCKVIKNDKKEGPSVGRNRGAGIAAGDVLIFIDSDVIIPPDTIEMIKKVMQNGNNDALIGLFSPRIRFKNFASNYKNLYMNYTYKNLPDLVASFCSSVAAVKKNVFVELKGFDENYRMPSVEDMEFGDRIARKYKLFMCKELEFEHIKRYTFLQVLKTDFARASGIMKIILRRKFREKTYFNDSTSPKVFKLSILLSAISALFFLAGFFFNPVFFVMAILCYFSICLLNYKFIKYVSENIQWEKKSLVFIKTGLFLISDIFMMGLGAFYGIISYLSGKKY